MCVNIYKSRKISPRETQPENDALEINRACVAGGIVNTSKVIAEELRSRAGNEEETF